MKYGAKGIKWAPFAAENPEPAGALPNYGTAVTLGALNKLTDNPTFNEGKGYGDNALKVHVTKFKENPIDIEVTTLPVDAAAALAGATRETISHDTHFNVADKAPYGGLAFYINKMNDNNQEIFQGIFYPKAKATMQGVEYTTSGDNITLTNDKLHFLGAVANNGDWKIVSDEFKTELEAEAWVDAMLAPPATDPEG